MINLYPYRTIPILYICFDKFCVRPHRQLSRKVAAKHYNLQSFLSHLLKSVCKISGNLCVYQILVAINNIHPNSALAYVKMHILCVFHIRKGKRTAKITYNLTESKRICITYADAQCGG